MTRKRWPLPQPYLALTISTTPPTPQSSPAMLAASSATFPVDEANRDSCRETSSSGARMCIMAVDSSTCCCGSTCGGSSFGAARLDSMLTTSISISRAFFARVWSTATGSLHPDMVPAAMMRFWSSGLMARRIFSPSPCSHRSLPLTKASSSSFVAGLDRPRKAPSRGAPGAPRAAPAGRPSWISSSRAFRTRAWMTAAGFLTLDIVPALMTRFWSTAGRSRRTFSASSGSHRLFCEMKDSSSSLLAGFVTSVVATMAAKALAWPTQATPLRRLPRPSPPGHHQGGGPATVAGRAWRGRGVPLETQKAMARRAAAPA
mmetsp:Transcript_31267/g.92833  ORF Transcript_31267/g.92833 Transcript_31267/m.92833 type:complete len:317 (+) Transcript_31267:372-1322(+)